MTVSLGGPPKIRRKGRRMTKSNLRDPKRKKTDLKSPLITGGAFGGIGDHLGRSKRGKTTLDAGLFRDNIYFLLLIYCRKAIWLVLPV